MENRRLAPLKPRPPAGPRYVDKRIVPSPFWPAVLLIGSFTALLYAVATLDRVLPADLVMRGIEPRSLSGLSSSILWKPLLNPGWEALAAHTLPVVVLGFLVTAGGLRQWTLVTATIWLVNGLGVWLIAEDNSVTIGVGGVTTGWLVFLVARGIATRGFLQLAVAGVVLLYWGGILRYVVPTELWMVWDGRVYGLSWESVLCGAIGGLLAMWFVAQGNRIRRVKSLSLSSREE